jgi:nucleotide-binding universal stress UspA family protein
MTSSPYARLLIGTDGSITANRAVERAVVLAGAFGARLHVAYVGEEELGRTVLAQVVAQHAGTVELEPHLLDGDPADALLGLAGAEQVDLIVVGNKGMAGAQRFLLGSVPNKVSHQATCDVLIVHTTAHTD